MDKPERLLYCGSKRIENGSSAKIAKAISKIEFSLLSNISDD